MNDLTIKMENLANFETALKLYGQEIHKLESAETGCLKVSWTGSKKLGHDELVILELFEA